MDDKDTTANIEKEIYAVYLYSENVQSDDLAVCIGNINQMN